jgi:hypothetical protein
MDVDQIKADLTAILPKAEIRLSDNGGFYWLSLAKEEPNGQTQTYSTRLPLDCTPLDIEIAAKHLQDE